MTTRHGFKPSCHAHQPDEPMPEDVLTFLDLNPASLAERFLGQLSIRCKVCFVCQ